MRVHAAKVTFGILAVLLGVSAAASGAHAEDGETDAQRRERLNARMAEMVRSGEGARLVQPESSAPRRRTEAPRTPATRAAAPALAPPAPAATTPVAASSRDGSWVLGSSSSASPAWTIAPPPANRPGSGARSGAYYVPPRLDLTTPPIVPTDPVECLTQAVYYEARNESEEGQAAVAEVVMNRTRSGVYPQSVCAVVYQRNSRTCQFTFTCDGAIGRGAVDLTKWARAERIARDVYDGRSPALLPPTSVNYHANYVSPSWGRRLERVRQIGAHIFYGAALAGGSTPGAALPATVTAAARGLVFVRNEGLDQTYDRLREASRAAASPAPSGQP
jgi:spore germination cell wall hydrolase CwlJ-like protein